MNRIGLDAFGEILADGAGRGIGGVGRTHDFAVARDGVFAFEHLHHDGAGDHERTQFLEERALLVDRVKILRLFEGQLDAFLSDDAQAGIFEPGIDLAGEIAEAFSMN